MFIMNGLTMKQIEIYEKSDIIICMSSYFNRTEKASLNFVYQFDLSLLALPILLGCLFIQVIYPKKYLQNVHVHDKSMYSRMYLN